MAHEAPVNEVYLKEAAKSGQEGFRLTLNGRVPYYTVRAKQKMAEFDFAFQHTGHSQPKL